MSEQGGSSSKKRPLELNWDTLLGNDEGEPVELVRSSNTAEETKCPEGGDGLEKLTDHQLEMKIKSAMDTYQRIAWRLKDKGEKLLANRRRLEAERERRKAYRAEKITNESEKPLRSAMIGLSNGSRQETSSPSHALGDSKFSEEFSMKKEMGYKTNKPFVKELSYLGSDKQKLNKEVSQSARGRRWPPSRNTPPQHQGNEKHHLSSSGKRGKSSSFYSGPFDTKTSNCFNRRDSVVRPSGTKPLKGHSLVLVVEDEPQPIETKEHEDEDSEWQSFFTFKNLIVKQTKIYYPSREDPEAIEIFNSDTECLAPEGYLSDKIMHFYIRNLQQRGSPSRLCDCHFFNTYFYKKLGETASSKGCDKEAVFVKFRRWWKGVNIFQKSYILIPIHEELHWSLVIICNPDKEDESGPLILHLDSLELHKSDVIFNNIKSFLKEEWNYLKKEVASYLPFPDRVWENLPRRIDEKKIPVPQQQNEYDCGLFVLYFIERFIEEAPKRLRKKDLTMFGKQWFRPEEASGLRLKIRNLLKEEFKKAHEGSL